MVKYSENWRPHRCNCPSKLLVGWWWRVVVVSLIGPWLEPCFHLWTKPCGQESDLPVIHGWRVNSMQSMWPTVGVGISPETISSNWGKRQQNNRCPWQLTWKCLSANIPKITWIHNRWVSQKSLLVMAQKSSPAFANLKPNSFYEIFVLLPWRAFVLSTNVFFSFFF